MTPPPTSPSLRALIAELNALSREAYGETAPIYSSRWAGRPRVYYINRQRQDLGPWLPADELFARGPLEHCKAKVRSASRHASFAATATRSGSGRMEQSSYRPATK